jgi:hypothetical protein
MRDSDVDLDRFCAVGLGAPVVSPWDNLTEFRENAALAATIPDADTDAGRFAILLEAIPEDGFGRAMLAGVAPVQLEVVDEDHAFADVTDGIAWKLTTADAGGAQILWKESGTGTKWGLVRLSPPEDHKVKVTSGDTTPDYASEKIFGDETWLYTRVVNGGADEELLMEHLGPYVSDPNMETDGWEGYDPDTGDLTVYEYKFDSKGHKVSFTAS